MADTRILMHLASCRDRLRRHQRLATFTAGLASAALVVAGVGFGGLAGAACVVAMIATAAAALALFRLHQLTMRYAELLTMVGVLAPSVANTTQTDMTAAPTDTSSDSAVDQPAADSEQPAGAAIMSTSDDMAERAQGMIVEATPESAPGALPALASAAETAKAVDTDSDPIANDAVSDGMVASIDDDRLLADAPLPEPHDGAPAMFETGRLIADALAELQAPTTITARPDFALPALSGETITSADLTGRATVLVFWRPGCDHCVRLTPELAAWESLQARSGPRLVVLAAADAPTAYRAHLPGTVLLDPAFSVGRAVDAPGTPAALVLDGDGQPLGGIAAGTVAVTGLLLAAMRYFESDEIDEPLDNDPVPAMTGVPAGDADAPALPSAAVIHHLDALAPATSERTDDWAGEAIRRTG